jgi:MFS family permease
MEYETLTPSMPPVAVPGPRRRGVFSVLNALRHRTFRSLRHADYRRYFFGQVVSFTGSWMQNAALMWLIYDLTANPLWPPLLLVAQVGPTLVLGTWGGNLADRLPKRRVIMATQTGFLVTALLLAVVTVAGLVSPWLLFAIQLVNGLIQSADLPARLAFAPDLVPREDLINAVSLNSMLFNSARAVGPALAGGAFLLAAAASDAGFAPRLTPTLLGAVGCFLFNAVTYAAVLVALSRITRDGRGVRSGQQSAWEGFRLAWASPPVRRLLGLSGLLCVFAWPALTLFPAYTRTVLGHSEREYSVLVSALGLGALAAALTTATFGSAERRGKLLVTGAGLSTVGLGGLAVAVHLPLALFSASTLGFGLVLFLTTGQATLQLDSTEATRGRMMALWAMMLSASAPVGHLAAGAAAQHYPVAAVLAALALGAACVTLLLVATSRPSKPLT